MSNKKQRGPGRPPIKVLTSDGRAFEGLAAVAEAFDISVGAASYFIKRGFIDLHDDECPRCNVKLFMEKK